MSFESTCVTAVNLRHHATAARPTLPTFRSWKRPMWISPWLRAPECRRWRFIVQSNSIDQNWSIIGLSVVLEKQFVGGSYPEMDTCVTNWENPKISNFAIRVSFSMRYMYKNDCCLSTVQKRCELRSTIKTPNPGRAGAGAVVCSKACTFLLSEPVGIATSLTAELFAIRCRYVSCLPNHMWMLTHFEDVNLWRHPVLCDFPM